MRVVIDPEGKGASTRDIVRAVVTRCRELDIPVLCTRFEFMIERMHWGSRRFLREPNTVSRIVTIRATDYTLMRLTFGDLVRHYDKVHIRR